MPSRLKRYLPPRPKHTALQNAFVIICNAHKASSSFLKQFEDIRRYRNAKGTPTDAEQDLLRAMLSFASAGLDSMAKQIVRDALPAIVAKDEGAAALFFQRTKKTIYRDNVLNSDLLLQAILAKCPRDLLVADLVRDLTSGSLQAVDELSRVGSFLNIPSKELIEDPKKMTRIFEIRNQIAHEMDIDFSQPNRRRHPRARDDMIDYTNALFKVAKTLLGKADERLA